MPLSRLPCVIRVRISAPNHNELKVIYIYYHFFFPFFSLFPFFFFSPSFSFFPSQKSIATSFCVTLFSHTRTNSMKTKDTRIQVVTYSLFPVSIPTYNLTVLDGVHIILFVRMNTSAPFSPPRHYSAAISFKLIAMAPSMISVTTEFTS